MVKTQAATWAGARRATTALTSRAKTTTKSPSMAQHPRHPKGLGRECGQTKRHDWISGASDRVRGTHPSAGDSYASLRSITRSITPPHKAEVSRYPNRTTGWKKQQHPRNPGSWPAPGLESSRHPPSIPLETCAGGPNWPRMMRNNDLTRTAMPKTGNDSRCQTGGAAPAAWAYGGKP